MTWISTELRSFALELEFDLDDNHGVSSTSSELLQIAKQLAAKTCDQDDERAIHKLDSCIDRLHSSMAHSPTTELMARRRLYTDACVLRALSGLVSAPKQSIGYLDRAIIIAGAPGPGRIDYIHALIKKIQADCLQVSFDDRVSESSTSAKFSAPGPLKLLSASTDIECLDVPPSMASFRSRYSQHPFILRGFAHRWPALQERPWSSLEYLKHVAGPGRVVPVEVGRDYREAGWTQQLMDWEEFLTHIELTDATSSHSVSNTKTPMYLAQHNLFTQFPCLRGDIIVPDYVYASPTPDEYASYQPPGNDDQLVINAWFGPRGTISPAHVDPYFNFYTQVAGYKTVWLASPRLSKSMYSMSQEEGGPAMQNTSNVDVFRDDCDGRFPAFWTDVAPHAMSATLGPGDVLFFPPGWWHAMQSETASFSVSMWF
ncbi:hypothetical protein ONZ45_g5379 [Pleurotus djamor]|nr:hypothetical protein ONZ45_g5379 [Pleurotus djamor]